MDHKRQDHDAVRGPYDPWVFRRVPGGLAPDVDVADVDEKISHCVVFCFRLMCVIQSKFFYALRRYSYGTHTEDRGSIRSLGYSAHVSKTIPKESMRPNNNTRVTLRSHGY